MFLGILGQRLLRQRLLAGFGFGFWLLAGSAGFACAGGGGASPSSRRSSRSAALPRRIDSAISSSVRTSLASAMSSITSSTSASSSGAYIIPVQPHAIAFDAGERAAEPLAALMGDRHLDLDEVASVALEIGTAHQRTVDARRRNLQPIGPVDRIGDVEHRRQRPRDRLAILDLHRSIGSFRHNLNGAAGLAGDLDPHQAVAHALQDRALRPPTRVPPRRARRRVAAQRAVRHPRNQRLDRSYPVSKSVWRDLSVRLVSRALPDRRSYRNRTPASRVHSGNKKERVPEGPLSIRDRMRTISCRRYSRFAAVRQGPTGPPGTILRAPRGLLPI